jgi:hypothetical protein
VKMWIWKLINSGWFTSFPTLSLFINWFNFVSSVHTLLPYDYYSLKFCRPKDGVKPYSENLGEFLRGDRIENSAYEVFWF